MDALVRLDTARPRRWHRELAEALRDVLDGSVHLESAMSEDRAAHRRLDRLVRIEGFLQGSDPSRLRLDDEAAMRFTARQADGATAPLVIDLAAHPNPVVHSWTVLFDGHPGMLAAADSLRAGRFPIVTLSAPGGEEWASARPGSEQPGSLGVALSDVLAGVVTLVSGAVRGQRFGAPVADVQPPGNPPSYRGLAARRVIDAGMLRAYRMLTRAPHWRTGWRRATGPDTLERGHHPEEGWSSLPDDGYHFYADPFLLERDGRTHLFLEDFDHRTGKGVISVVELTERGPVGRPRTILQHDAHLSYPFVLEHDGDVWMIPETSGAQTVELYRAVSYPDVWERKEILLDGLTISDATPFQHEGRWWMTGTVRDGGSYSDALYLWSAADLRGPWEPFHANPVLVDIASARPAGAVALRGGRLLRPTQDCRAGYGAALNVMEITRLDHEGFEQRLVAHLEPSDQWPGRRLHTLNSGGGFEVVDGSRLSFRASWFRGRAGRPES